MSLTLYKFGPQWEITDPSPFCVKLESFLRINEIPHTISESSIKDSMAKAPKGKLPFVIFQNGEKMGDSTLIIERIASLHKIDMDNNLSIEQRSTSHAFCKMLDESVYWTLVYSRWADDAGWNILRPLFFDFVPAILRGLISKMVRKKLLKTLYLQGTARHTRKEIYENGHKDLMALSNFLGKDKWFFDAKHPGLLDIYCHAYIINIIRPPIETPQKEQVTALKNLVRHAEEFQSLIYCVDEEIKRAA